MRLMRILTGLSLTTIVAFPLNAEPTVFAPGVISSAAHDSAPAITPDGRTIFFGRSTPAASLIMVSNRTPSGWSRPEVASFSGRWLDMEPTMAPDGSYMVFASNRPASRNGPPVDGVIDGKPRPGKGSNLWRVNLVRGTWGEPVRLPEIINTGGSLYAPSVASDGTLFFMKPSTSTGKFQLFSARAEAGGYDRPQPLPFSDGSVSDVDPAVAADQSFLIFGSGRHSNKDIDLYIVRRQGDGWGRPQYLGDVINGPTSDAEPRLSPDGRTLYFSSERLAPVDNPIAPGDLARVAADMVSWNNGLYNIWRTALTPVLATFPARKERLAVVAAGPDRSWEVRRR